MKLGSFVAFFLFVVFVAAVAKENSEEVARSFHRRAACGRRIFAVAVEILSTAAIAFSATTEAALSATIASSTTVFTAISAATVTTVSRFQSGGVGIF